MTHGGQLFGLLVLEREEGIDEFNEEEERVLTELARQVALALHNSELDTALRATLEEVQHKNVELQESRARIVATADAERRKIERNLHDGAQQHLVALAVQLRLIQRIGESDPSSALAMVDEARNAALATVEELRALAHGIYPPLLMEKGLGEALRAAAGRAVLPTTVDAVDLGRYAQDIEAAVYFCCLEAMQNAGKHAGEDATVTVSLQQVDGELRFAVRDDGAGFDVGSRPGGHGFVNMADRLGAIGGNAEVTSSLGKGTTVSGRIPTVPIAVG
jgi:signal transduction histidine kinase